VHLLMRRGIANVCLPLGILSALLGASAYCGSEVKQSEAVDFFERRVRPLLVEHCYECHRGVSAKGSLHLDSLAGLARGGVGGPALNVEERHASRLLSALRYESLEMPPRGKLPPEAIEVVANWANMLDADLISSWSEEPAALSETNSQQPNSPGGHWSLIPPEQPPPPEVKQLAWCRGDIDRFVLHKLESAGLTPAADAAPRDLVRRVTYDAIGLPPPAAQVAAFLADPSDQAYERIVDTLLASPQFGERWARLWLDLARYADTKGYVFQEHRSYKHAWKYRDWVVEAFNRDLPYDKFVVAQLAGEQTPDPPSVAPAAGFLTLGRRFLNNPHDIIDDRIDVITRGLLGMTVACARCHDHKYDPIPTADYYALYGIFASSEEQPHAELPPQLVDRPAPVEPVVFLRGNPGAPGPQVPRRFLTCVAKPAAPAFSHGSGRLELAQAIVDPKNPLTARVWVNRLWERLLGRGIVATTSDFGVRGAPPTHPELLDFLATRFIEQGWSTKKLLREILLSTSYRQATTPASATAQLAGNFDADNTLLWHAHRKRLDLEQFRDSLLAAAGTLDLTLGGAPVALTEASPASRRALYGLIDRQNLPAFFRTFDFANPNTHSAVRARTLSPHQALYLLNSPLVLDAACGLAARSVPPGAPSADPTAESPARIHRLFEFAFGRPPTTEEADAALQFVNAPSESAESVIPARSPWNYGWMRTDPVTERLEFINFPHFNGEQWRPGSEFPHPEFAFAQWTKQGGHPGRPSHPLALRFVSARSGLANISITLRHPHDQGDGVRLRVIAPTGQVLSEVSAHHGEELATAQLEGLIAGKPLDFIVDCRDADAYDTFELFVEVAICDALGKTVMHRSPDDFHGPEAPPLDRWQQLAQSLLMSNEFIFLE